MNRHQVLTGAVNAGENCYAVGGVDGVPFIAYAAGCNIVILSSNYQRVQIIPGVSHENVQISCLDCSADFGKIAVSYGKKICVFEPTPLLNQSSLHRLDYRWVQTASFMADCYNRVLSWNPDGTQLLTGGDCIQMWLLAIKQPEDVKFHIGKDFDSPRVTEEEDGPKWDCVWKCKTSNPVNFLKFSPDGMLFASAGNVDRLVKIWYENKKVNFVSQTSSGLSTSNDFSYTFIYIAHPRAVSSLSWRKTSKYMPRSSVANMLVTSCKDNICRLWVQTLLPEDGLINIQQIEALANQAPHLQTQRHRQRIMQRLKHMKSFNQYKKRQATQFIEDPQEIVPTLPSTYSVHDFHSFGIQGSGVAPGIHFHLAASINAATDIPLVPTIGSSTGSKQPNFVLHWLNNKEVIFSESTEQLLRQLSQKVMQQEATAAAAAAESESECGEMDSQSSQVEGSVHSQNKTRKHMAHDFASEETLGDDLSARQTVSAVSSSVSLATDAGQNQIQAPLIDALDRKIDSLLREWQNSPDLLFSIHPIDGSFLVWLVEWLDEYSPGAFRQAQVSFCSRIPNAFPLGDAATMSEYLTLYSPRGGIALRTAIQDTVIVSDCHEAHPKTNENHDSADLNESFGSRKEDLFNNNMTDNSPTPVLCMTSKHVNGSLNLWHLTFGDNSNYTQVLSISHSARVCGHRFRINDVTCHPVLPLLLTTSHHNVPTQGRSNAGTPSPTNSANNQNDNPPFSLGCDKSGFCSELILWKVDPVGPLSKSGGVSELARINSPEMSAFANVAWIPTLLPSTTLGSISNSPSACFVASDGQRLRIYQAVIDARTILAEISASVRKRNHDDFTGSMSSDTSSGLGYRHVSLQDSFKIVSLQSTARPGCVLELDAIADASHMWQNTQLLHVFQEQLIMGKRTKPSLDTEKIGLVEPGLQAVVDLRNTAVFEEPFYLVVVEKNESGQSVLHMWRILMASHPGEDGQEMPYNYVPDSNLVQDSDHSNQSSRSNSPGPENAQPQASPLHITTTKVCMQVLPLPDDCEIVHTTPAAGHLSSSSIYPACLAPYLFCTACSDGEVRFWYCKPCETSNEGEDTQFVWTEWTMMMNNQQSKIDIDGELLYVSCAYSGRVACAYKNGRSYTVPTNESAPSSRYVNISVAIFECESTGGSEWILEDTIPLKNVSLPQPDLFKNLDLNSLYDVNLRNKHTVDVIMNKLAPNDDVANEHRPSIQRLLSVPSYTTLHTLKKAIAEQGNQCLLTQKSLVQLDWVSTEDGSHVLTVSVGSKLLLFTPVSTDIAQANVQALKASKTTGNRTLLKQASSMAPALLQPEQMRWMCLRTTFLSTVDSLPPLPMQMSWVRDGILVVGMDSEMHIYSQWRPTNPEEVEILKRNEAANDIRSLKEQEILTRAQEASQLRLPGATGGMSRNTSSSVITSWGDTRKKKEVQDKSNFESIDALPDFGLFEASRLACPVLPQYHPKQLMELLEFGKIRRVKAIMCHLVKCLAGMENFKKSYEHFIESADVNGTDGDGSARTWSRSRALSIAASSPLQPSPSEPQGSVSVFPEEIQLDYVEITSIPPLPLFTLLAVDNEATQTNAGTQKEQKIDKDYNDLFDLGASLPDDPLDFMNDNATKIPKIENNETEEFNITQFGPRQVKLLTKLLTHTHLPGLSSLDQMHVLALADTVASCSSNTFSQCNPNYLSENTDGSSNNLAMSVDSLDECGLRFLFAMRHHMYLTCCLPLSQRAQLQKMGLGSHSVVWAFHSETQEELLQLIPSIQKANPRWIDLKELGFGWWMRNNTTLRQVMEKVAKAAFQARNDPLDAALYYLAMKKKNLVWGLFRSVRDTKMTQFFQNNFSEDRWRKAALKNAFALLGRQRFEHAAAFFLLAGALRDAVDVCLHKLDDLQLAMVLVRLHDGELESNTPSLRRLLFEEILGCDSEGENYRQSKAHPDPFLRSMALWTMQDYSGALTTLLQTDIGHAHPKLTSEDLKYTGEELTANPSVFNFYLYLRTHSFVVRSYAVQFNSQKKTIKHQKSGFGSSIVSPGAVDCWLSKDEAITPLERRLFFTTAHYHFQAGCPALALEVLSRLPDNVILNMDMSGDSGFHHQPVEIQLSKTEDSVNQFDWSQPVTSAPKQDLDWSQPVVSSQQFEKSDSVDWSQPLAVAKDPLDDFNWGEPVGYQKKDLLSTDVSCHDSDPSSDDDFGIQMKTKETKDVSLEPIENDTKEKSFDVMAQQLKFIACLKIMMEELSTLATGFEVDGGQLRYHLYIWLERSVSSLCDLCHYGRGQSVEDYNSMGTEETEVEIGSSMNPELTREAYPTLHEILMADTMDFEDKLQRAARRKKWLKVNETLLRTLLSYCSLHGAHGGGLAAVRMELMLLLQELQQERSQHQLLSPLPFPTTLPLLAASVASQKTVVTDPIRFLQSLTHDLLESIVTIGNPPTVFSGNDAALSIIRDLSTALSACIYQSLCDSDNFIVKQSGVKAQTLEDFISSSVVYQNSHLLAGHHRQNFNMIEETMQATTPPSKWPGVQSLRALLARDKDEDSPKLHTLLCEAFVSVYLSQLVYALGTYDCHILYRLIDRTVTEKTWASLFGGGTKRLLRVSTAVSPALQAPDPSKQQVPGESSILNTLSKQRVKLHMKLLSQLGQGTPQPAIKEDRPTYREQFIPPEMSMVSCFMSKPQLPDDWKELDYDSNESLPSSEDEEENDDVLEDDFGESYNSQSAPKKEPSTVFMEQLDPSSFSWAIIRLAVVKLAKCYLQSFLDIAGIEITDLPVTSPMIHAVLKVLEQWLKHLKEVLDDFGKPPTNFLPNLALQTGNGPPLAKYKVLLDVNNTPFKSHHPLAMSARRLWNFLVRQDPVQDIFIRYIFSRKHQHLQNVEDHVDTEAESEIASMQPVRIVHKDQDSILSFCISKVNHETLTLSTLKEIQELDISLLLEPAPWLEDEAEYDILNFQKATEQHPASDYIVVQHPSDKGLSSASYGQGGPNGDGSAFTSPTGPAPPLLGTQTGRASNVMKSHHIPGSINPQFCQFVLDRSRHLLKPLKKHKTDGVRRLCSHPFLPIYLSGAQDGSVKMWEWGHQQPVSVPRPSGTYAKVTKVAFNAQGNKFGVTDGDGFLSLWQVGLTSVTTSPFFSIQCHTKQASDFDFVGSSSLLATAGQSSEGRNVSLWDTLLPQRKAQVASFTCHEHGSSACVYASRNQVLISAGKKGDICIFDVRQRQLRHVFQAHDHPVKCLSLDPGEEFYVTGSANGDIKVWGLNYHLLLYSFPGEHSRSTLFRNIGMGVSQLYVDRTGKLFSCGADGSLKLRQLPERDLIVKALV